MFEHDESAGVPPRGGAEKCTTCGQKWPAKDSACSTCNDYGHFMIGHICAVTCSKCDACRRGPLPQNAGYDVQWIFHHTVPDEERLKKGGSSYALPIIQFDKGENPPIWGTL